MKDQLSSSELVIYNTLSNKKEVFVPINKDSVGMYVCGPTVYGEPHLGHARSAVTFDIVSRYLKFIGYKVRYVRNITDVGHLENDADEGEDKIAKKARIEKIEPMEVAQFYTNLYRDLLNKMNIQPPSIEPLASGHIIEQINIIQQILDNGLAYIVNGSVYFDVKKYVKRFKYGELSGKVIEELLSGTRELEGQQEKMFHADFALWKKANNEHIMKWSSPWGEGFPGWHIECTAMSSKYLGIPFDIHGGGLDLTFPHHEAEIAQSYGAFSKAPVNYWMHNNMVTLEGQKMAKSKGNYISLQQLFEGNHPLLEKAYSPMVIRFFLLQTHYRSTIDFSNTALKASEVALKKITNCLKSLELMTYSNTIIVNELLDEKINKLCAKMYHAMNDDFNTPLLISILFEIVSIVNSSDSSFVHSISSSTFDQLKSTYQYFVKSVLGVEISDNLSNLKIDEIMEFVINWRNEEKNNKNYLKSDQIRKDLLKIGIEINDSKTGSTYKFSN
jgi:cysteinyl-tRNA synthetase